MNRLELRRANLAKASLARADLSEVDLSQADLREADLSHADLTEADLSGANLSGAFLYQAQLSRARLVDANLEGASLRRANLQSCNLTGASLRAVALTGASLAGGKLDHADLTEAKLHNADLFRATLVGATLISAELPEANLRLAKLQGAVLRDARLGGTNLVAADLSQADLSGAVLHQTNLLGANLTGVFVDLTTELKSTLLVAVDLAGFCSSEVLHEGPSLVEFRSIVQSLHVPESRLKTFLRRTGMPDVFIDYNLSCAQTLSPTGATSLLRSTFISYGGPDEPFAQKLSGALEEQGVTTFFFKEHAPPGERLHRVMREGINKYDRVVLVCSERSLDRHGVANEIEETLAREARDGGETYLIPITLDDYVYGRWNPGRIDLVQAVRDRVIADFSAHREPGKFAMAISRLIGVLKRPLREVH